MSDLDFSSQAAPVSTGALDFSAQAEPVKKVGAAAMAGRQFVAGGGDLINALDFANQHLNPAAMVSSGMAKMMGEPDPDPLPALAQNAQQFGALSPDEAPDGLGARVAGGAARMLPNLAAAIGTGGESSLAGVVPQALRSVPVLGRVLTGIGAGAPTAAVLTGEQAANLPDTMTAADKAEATAKNLGVNLAMAGLPIAAGSGPMTRAITGGAIGYGSSAGAAALQGQPQDQAQNIVGGLMGAMLGQHSAEAPGAPLDPYIARYNESAGEAPPAGPALLGGPDFSAKAEPVAPPPAAVAPAAPAAAPFDPKVAETAFKADPVTALASLDHPTLVQVAKDAGFSVKPTDAPAAIIAKITSQPTAFLHSDVLPEYMAAVTPQNPTPTTAENPTPTPSAVAPAQEVGAVNPPSMASLLAPNSHVAVDSAGTAYTPDQGMSAILGGMRTSELPQLPAPVTTVDSYGNAKDSGAFLREARQAQADSDAAAQLKASKATLGITPDIERTQTPAWKAREAAQADIQARQDARDAENGDLAIQRTDDAPPWWMAGEHASDEHDAEESNAVVGQREDDSPPWWVAGQHEESMWEPPVKALDTQAAATEDGALHADPGEKPEVATPTVIGESMGKAVDNTQLDRAGAKRDILTKITEAQKDANADPWPVVPNGGPRMQAAKNERQRIIKDAGYVSIDVPGDGKFQVVNNRQALDAFRDKVEKNPGFKKPTTTSFGTKPSLRMSPADRAKVMAEAQDNGELAQPKSTDGVESLFRGTGGDAGAGNYFSPDKEFARNFTRSGQDHEIQQRDVRTADIHEPKTLPFAGDEAQMDAAIAEAKGAGKKALRVDEGQGQPSSVYVFDKSAIIKRPAVSQNTVSDAGEGKFAVPQTDRRPDWSPRVDRKALTQIDSLVERFDGSTLADTIAQDFHEHQGAELIGQTINSHDDLAALASVYRNPAFETMRYIYVDDAGTVLGETAVSSRSPSTTQAFPRTEADGAKWLVESAPEGATGVWLSHNHPSGDPAPSSQDTEFTGELSIKLGDMAGAPKVRGHVVLDHDTFGRISAGGEDLGIGKVRGAAEFDPLRNPRGEDFYGEAVNSPAFAAGAGKRIAAMTPEDSSAVIVMGNRGQVVSVHTFPNGVLATPQGFALISRIGAKRGAVGIAVVTSKENFAKHFGNLKEAVNRNLLYDIKIVDNDGNALSMGQEKQMSGSLFGKHTAGSRQRAQNGKQLHEGGGVAEPAPMSLTAVKQALRNRGVSDDAIDAMTRDQLRAEQANLRMRSAPTPEQKVTGIKNAAVAEERAMKGQAEVEHDLSRTDREGWDIAKARLADNPSYGTDLAASLVKKPRPATKEETFALTLDRMRISKDRRAAYDDAQQALKAGNESDQLRAQQRIEALDAQMEANDIAGRVTGYETASGLAARRAMVREDYSMASLAVQGKVKAGRALTSDERAELDARAKDIEDREAAVAKREAELRNRRRSTGTPEKTATTAKARFDDLAAQLRKIAEKDQLKPGCVV